MDLTFPYGACQAPLSMGFFRQEYWSGLPFPSPQMNLMLFLIVMCLSKIPCQNKTARITVQFEWLRSERWFQDPWEHPSEFNPVYVVFKRLSLNENNQGFWFFSSSDPKYLISLHFSCSLCLEGTSWPVAFLLDWLACKSYSPSVHPAIQAYIHQGQSCHVWSMRYEGAGAKLKKPILQE